MKQFWVLALLVTLTLFAQLPISRNGGGGSANVGTSPQSSIIVGGTSTDQTFDVDTSYINTLYPQLGAANLFGAFKQTFQPSVTTAALRITGGAIPTANPHTAGDIIISAAGRLVWGDGANDQYSVSIAASGITAPTQPTAGNLAVWGAGFTVTDGGAVPSGAANYYTNSTGTGVGPTSFVPLVTDTLRVYDATTTTGITRLRLKAGAGQAANKIFEVFDNSDVSIMEITTSGGVTIKSQKWADYSGSSFDYNGIIQVAASTHCWGARSCDSSAADGKRLLANQNGDGFTILQFGVVGVTGPALTTTIQTNPLIAITDGTGGATANLLIPAQKSTTGQRYVCIDTNGKLVSSMAACVGT